MAVRLAVLAFQLGLVTWAQWSRASVRVVTARVYGRELKPWQLRAYRRAGLVVLALTAAYDLVLVVGA